MSKVHAQHRTNVSSPWKATAGASLGTAIEYYDFQLYAVLAVTLAPLFFSDSASTDALLYTLAIFAGAFVVRPAGAVFFGWFGDRYGRIAALQLTIIGTGAASALIGVLPTAAAIGIAAPALLLLLRLLQGFFAGGEVTGAATYVSECAPANRRGFYGSFNAAATTLGLMGANVVVAITQSSFGQSAVEQWAWRVPFLLSVPLLAVCLWARLRLEDSEKFRDIVRDHRNAQSPLRDVLTSHIGSLVKVVCLAFAQSAAGYVCLIYLSMHLTRVVGYDTEPVYWLMSTVTLAAALIMPIFGSLSDRVGRKRMFAIGLLGYAVAAPSTFYAVGLHDFALAQIAVALSIVPFAIVQSVGYSMYTELFPTAVRYSGTSLGFNVAAILGGGTAPYVSTWLISWTGDTLAPAWYVVGAALIGLLTLATVEETAHKELRSR